MRTFAIRSLLLSMFMLAMSAASFGQVGVSITIAPPELPVYEQPACPGDGYIWTPGYWAWDDAAGDYYWVPGTWVEAPEVGYLWTPAWWGWSGGFYLFHAGYWGPHIGFYGGINYGFGYFGHGFVGGRWDGGHFFYNRAVWNVDNRVVHNVYEERVDVRVENHVSFNGGRGGISDRPTREEETADHDRHVGAVGAQVQHAQAARSNTALRYSSNHGKPPIGATSRPGEFNERGGGGGNAKTAVHPKELPPTEHVAPAKTGNPKTDQRYQQQADKLAAQQEKERQNLQQKQEQEHQKLAKQNAPAQRTQQVEQKHAQQTQQLQQRHEQQRQQLQTRQAPAASKGESKKK
ncbi:MAG: YXWGXW repeat-containing protein [Candidatus Acidiferrales bacterium]